MSTKYMDIKDFRENGYLQELNRTFLHPMGLALEVILEEDGSEYLGGIWDYQDDPEGIYFAEEISQDKINFVKKIQEEKFPIRKEAIGYIIQEK